VQIFSRGNTSGMYGGRAGREYITRTQPDNRGLPIGTVVGRDGSDILVDVTHAIAIGDGIGFESPDANVATTIGGLVSGVRTISLRNGMHRQALGMRVRANTGWRVVRSSDVTLMRTAQESFADVAVPARVGRTAVNVRVFGHAGGPLKTTWSFGENEVTVRGETPLAPASRRSLDLTQLREQLGRLGETAFVLASLEASGLGDGLFLPISELNRIRQQAVEQLDERLGWMLMSRTATRDAQIAEAVADVPGIITDAPVESETAFALRAIVYNLDDARAAAAAGATEIVFDPFLRHPAPPLARVNALRDHLATLGVSLRLRTPTIVRPDERKRLDKWLALGLSLLSGHLGLVAEQGSAGTDVIADYATNTFNAHTAALLFELGAKQLTASIELTLDEIGALVKPWGGAGFDVLVYGRPEGMTIEHCVLSAAFDREPATCRDLCVQKHVNVSITDPAGYTFAVATDSACRNRLLHSRPIDASEYLPTLWAHGIRGFQLLFNVPGDAVTEITRAYRDALDALAESREPALTATRTLLDGVFTRGHFNRAV